MLINLAGIYVTDQDAARRFYTEVLGFRLKDDVPYDEVERWLTVVSPERPDGAALGLNLADDAARALQRKRREDGTPAIAFATTDIGTEYERLKGRGVVFTMEPTTMPYGGTDAVFDDTCGNLICLHQD